MNKIFFLIFFLGIEIFSNAQHIPVLVDSIPVGYFVTVSEFEWMEKLTDLPLGVNINDSIPLIIQKIERYVLSYKPNSKYPDDLFAREAIIQTIISFKEGGYGIGAILIDSKGNIIAENHNSQIQKHRSDLHAEMNLLTEFEESPLAGKYQNVFVYYPGLTVFSSAEPCPMCLIRLAAAGVNTKFCCPGPDDGMADRIDCLPLYWKDLAHKYPCVKANTSPILQKIAHLMFYSFLVDNRGPK
jgi:tRNA(Arg) A34 adenosine deaminase TadA